MNYKHFFLLLTIFVHDIYHQVEHVLPGRKSHQENTAEYLLDLNAHLGLSHPVAELSGLIKNEAF